MAAEGLYIFEGYDGAGKSTLIRKIRGLLANTSVRVVGRKSEPELMQISNIIERPEPPLSHGADLLLRLALEIERVELVHRCQREADLVFMDRGPISLEAWVSYYNLDRVKYGLIFDQIESSLNGATIFLCTCSFETCWKRICEKPNKSNKELLGEAINGEWYQRYMRAAEAFKTRREFRLVQVDTEHNITQSEEHAMKYLPT
jgi:thymidylate kinase